MDTVDLKLAQDCESLAVAASEGVNWLKDAANQSPTVAQQAPSLISELQKVRNQSRKLARAARRRMCAGVFGPSQAGKSYLVSILASRDGRPMQAQFGDKSYDFLREINPPGNREYELPEIAFEFRGPMWLGARQLDLVRWPAARLYALEFARPEYAERHARETPFKIALARVKPKDKDSGDVERFRLRQVTNRDGRAVALDRLTLRLQTLPRREGYWLDTGMLKTG